MTLEETEVQEAHDEIHDEDVKVAAKNYIKEFFQNRSWHCGGKIPQRELLSEANVDMVVSSKFCKDWENTVHLKCMGKIKPDPNYKDETLLPWTVRYLIDLLSSMSVYSIPKEFRPGMVLLYFRFCKGIKY